MLSHNFRPFPGPEKRLRAVRLAVRYRVL